MIETLLQSPSSWTNFFIFFGLAVLLLFAVLGFVTYGILAERKVMGFMQGRIGPNQVGGPVWSVANGSRCFKTIIERR